MDHHPTLTVTLETVTPLFLGGAEPRGKPELRPPAFRGALRYWLRAALGGVMGGDVEAVRKAEAEVFGSADEKTGCASAVTMRITAPRLSILSYSQIAERDQRTNSYAKRGIAYLLFAARRTASEPERSGLLGTFDLSLSMRPGATESEDKLRKAYIALWLLLHLGGMGARSRRGAGGLTAQNEPFSMQNLPSLPIRARKPEELATEIGESLKKIRQALDDGKGRHPIQQPPSFDILHPDTCKIWVVNKAYEGWKQAMEEFGQVYQSFRSRRAPAVQRAAFGLPIPYYYRSLGGEKATLESESHDRRASPLWVRIVKLADGKYTIVLSWFQSQFLPDGEKLLLRQGRASLQGSAPDTSLIETFITGDDRSKSSALKDKGLATLEVRYA